MIDSERMQDKRNTYFTGTREWACKTFNTCMGCSHDCAYCYAKSMAIRFGRATAESWHNQIALPEKAILSLRGKPTRVMFPSTHDITPECLGVCKDALRHLLDKGHDVLIVSKPHYECIQAICDWFPYHRDKILFRFTMGSRSDAVLKAWEPYAPCYGERLASLRHAYDLEFKTSISCEPMLDIQIEDVVGEVDDYVSDTIWIGMMNDMKQRLSMNKASPEIKKMGEELMKQCSVEFIRGLYARLKDNPKIRWKYSIKKMLELEPPAVAGLDI